MITAIDVQNALKPYLTEEGMKLVMEANDWWYAWDARDKTQDGRVRLIISTGIFL